MPVCRARHRQAGQPEGDPVSDREVSFEALPHFLSFSRSISPCLFQAQGSNRSVLTLLGRGLEYLVEIGFEDFLDLPVDGH